MVAESYMVALRFESSLTTDGTNPETLKDKVGDNWKDNNMGLQARGFQGGRQPKWGFESPALTTKKKVTKRLGSERKNAYLYV